MPIYQLKQQTFLRNSFDYKFEGTSQARLIRLNAGPSYETEYFLRGNQNSPVKNKDRKTKFEQNRDQALLNHRSSRIRSESRNPRSTTMTSSFLTYWRIYRVNFARERKPHSVSWKLSKIQYTGLPYTKASYLI